ncbi:MAG TPA: serine hydrolase domain-containing protein [Urbifossiella sp.]|nr:serine hydrolase domain-containing protein [Urbifossiella sp.]
MMLLRPLAAVAAALLVAAGGPAADPAAPELAAAVRPYVEREALAGAAFLVADKERVLGRDSVGFADIAGRAPMSPDALFWIASMSKPVTAAALMILVDEGKVKLDDPVSAYLPEFAGVKVQPDKAKAEFRAPARAMTVRDLLRHTSGMPFASAAEAPTLDGLPLKDAVASYARTPLHSDPGAKYLYANTGINTAGRIIEVTSGTSYEAFLDARLFGPLGMTDTTFWPSEAQAKRLATGYRPGEDKKGLVATKVAQLRYPLTDRTTRHPMPGGGLFSTTDDVAKFGRMVLNGGELGGKRVLSAAAVKEMTTRQTPAEMKESYGLGWAVGGDGYGHGGAWATNLWLNPSAGRVYVWMVQHNGFPADGGQAQGAFRRAADVKYPPAKR